MVVPETEAMSSQGEAESSLPATKSDRNQKHTNQNTTSNNKSNNDNSMSLLGRQSSIYSLTLDEFQHTLSESGKNFGSMNMDEFLTSIWTAEENQQQQQQHHGNTSATSSLVNGSGQQPGQLLALSDLLTFEKGGGGGGGGGAVTRQQSLSRQGSLSVPAPLCRKTVEEVWSEIHKKDAAPAEKQSNTNHHHHHHHHHQHQQHQHHHNQQQQHDDNNNSDAGSGRGKSAQSAARQPTFGEMTLEDFLIKAGVVREQGAAPAAAAAAASVGAAAPQPQVQPYAVGTVFVGGYGGRAGNGYGVGPVSPVSSDGMCGSQAENNSSGHFGMEMGMYRGRKRVIDGPVEKVVERRQRRMIKNRESAARSRARKQAYTVELEAELNQLREENERLKHAVAEGERKKKQLYVEEMKIKAQNKAKACRAKEKVWLFRRNLSCPL